MIVVPGHGPSTAANDVVAVCDIIEYPIHEPAAIYPVRVIGPGGGTAGRSVSADTVHIFYQLRQEISLLQ